MVKPARCTTVSNLFYWSKILHVSDGLSVHHQEFKSVHTATGICQTDTADRLLASNYWLWAERPSLWLRVHGTPPTQSWLFAFSLSRIACPGTFRTAERGFGPRCKDFWPPPKGGPAKKCLYLSCMDVQKRNTCAAWYANEIWSAKRKHLLLKVI